MPFENVWDKDCRNEICGYFKSYAWGLQGQIGDKYAMDADGNSDLEMGIRIAYKERKRKKKLLKPLLIILTILGNMLLCQQNLLVLLQKIFLVVKN